MGTRHELLGNCCTLGRRLTPAQGRGTGGRPRGLRVHQHSPPASARTASKQLSGAEAHCTSVNTLACTSVKYTCLYIVLHTHQNNIRKWTSYSKLTACKRTSRKCTTTKERMATQKRTIMLHQATGDKTHKHEKNKQLHPRGRRP